MPTVSLLGLSLAGKGLALLLPKNCRASGAKLDPIRPAPYICEIADAIGNRRSNASQF
jgi:hypothetical protein